MKAKKTEEREAKISKILTKIREARASLSFLGETCGLLNKTGRDAMFINALSLSLKLMERDILMLSDNPKTGARLRLVLDDEPDSVDVINRLLSEFLENTNCASAIWKTVSSSLKIRVGAMSPELIRRLKIKVEHARRLMLHADEIIDEYEEIFSLFCEEKGMSRLLNPKYKSPRESKAARAFLELDIENISDENLLLQLANIEDDSEDEPQRKILRRCDGDLVEVELQKPRPIDRFFGYPTARIFFRKYLQSFAEGKENSPLLITSLPGLGKTHFTISFTLAMPNLTLILCEPQDLECALEKIIKELSFRQNRRFVMFFDDVDTRKVNWYYFRTHVGGTFNLPPNILIVIASNYDFPANISSRGRCFSFPLFDEINCMDMIHDYLLSIGMKSPTKELVSTIAADYVEEYGQRVFEELSPRTLVRYLDKFHSDTAKRIKLLNISRDKVVPIPEAAIFYETNQKVIQRLKESV